MAGLLLLVTVTTLYAGYNLLIKVSAAQVPAAATSTIVATICLQVAALMTSIVFVSVVMVRGGQVLQLSWGACAWRIPIMSTNRPYFPCYVGKIP